MYMLCRFTSSIYQTMSEWPWSGYRQLDRGLLLDFAFNSSALLKHNLQWDVAVRDLSVMSRTTSFAVREQSGLTLKSALRHILSLDQRDEPIFPTEGTLLRLTTELAGFGGDVGFLKNDLHAQTNYTLVQDVVVQAAVQAGFLRPMNDDKKITLNDRSILSGRTAEFTRFPHARCWAAHRWQCSRVGRVLERSPAPVHAVTFQAGPRWIWRVVPNTLLRERRQCGTHET